MPVAEVTFYDVVLWLHISAVVVGFGSTFAFGVVAAAAAAANPRSVPAVGAGIAAASRTLVLIGGLIVLVTGIYLTADRWEFSDFFIAWGIIAVLALLGLTYGYFGPQGRKVSEAAQGDIERAGPGDVELGEEFKRLNSNVARMGAIAGLIVILTIYVMTTKPFL